MNMYLNLFNFFANLICCVMNLLFLMGGILVFDSFEQFVLSVWLMGIGLEFSFLE